MNGVVERFGQVARELCVRPRLYESKPDTLTAALQDFLKAIDVVYV